MSDDPKKIIVDEDWKTKAAAEKLAAEQARKGGDSAKESAGEQAQTEAKSESAPQSQSQTQASPEAEPTADAKASEGSQKAGSEAGSEAASAGSRTMPPAKFDTLVSTLAMQAASAMGLLRMEGAPDMPVDMDIARHMIDLLEVLAAKTKGNLTGEEHKALQDTLHQLRMAFVSMSSDPGSSESSPE